MQSFFKNQKRAGREPKTAVLLYHSLGESKFDPYKIRVSPANFEAHMEWIKKNSPVFSLGEFVLKKKAGKLPERSVALSFDDGYENHYSLAKPVLEKLELPAVFFVTTGLIGTEKGFWWDSVEAILSFPEKLPEAWKFEAGGKPHHLRFESNAAAFARASRSGNLKDFPEGLEKNLSFLSRALRDLEPSQREAVLEDLFMEMGCPERGFFRQKLLSAAQIREIASHPLFEIGAHTVSHRTLSGLDDEEQFLEIFESKRELETLTGKAVRHFAYPFGAKTDYNSRSVELVRQAGFESAVTTELCWGPSGIFEIPRITLRNDPLAVFQKTMKEIFD